MKRKFLRSLIIAIVCLVAGVAIIVVNFSLDNTIGKGYAGSMSTLSDYHRSLVMVISAIVLATASVVMIIMTLITFMRRKQSEDEELLRKLEEEMRVAEEGTDE